MNVQNVDDERMLKEPLLYIGLKCVLEHNLTKYRTGLVPGCIGTIINNSRMGDRFYVVRFSDPACTLDVVEDGLTPIITDDYRNRWNKINAQKERKYKLATNVIHLTGPKGGHRGVSFDYIDETGGKFSCFIANKEETEKYLEKFRENGIKITVKIDQ